MMAFTVNDVAVLFEPENEAYRQAFSALACELDDLQEQLERALKKGHKSGGKANAKAYGVGRNVDSAMREKLDALLGEGVCTGIYGDTPLFAMSQNTPLWFGLIEGLYGAMDAQQRPKNCAAVMMKYRTKRIARNRQ